MYGGQTVTPTHKHSQKQSTVSGMSVPDAVLHLPHCLALAKIEILNGNVWDQQCGAGQPSTDSHKAGRAVGVLWRKHDSRPLTSSTRDRAGLGSSHGDSLDPCCAETSSCLHVHAESLLSNSIIKHSEWCLLLTCTVLGICLSILQSFWQARVTKCSSAIHGCYHSTIYCTTLC